jgi:hypothetical protein
MTLTPTASSTSSTIYVELAGLRAWEVVLPERGRRVTCETLEDARHVAYQCAARRPPCEVVVRDAYHRVLQRALIDAPGEPAQPTD